MLAKDGHLVTLTADGAEAIAAVMIQTFDLIFMDMQMPFMDGLEATRRIRTLPCPSCNTPIIALTANAMNEQVNQCRDAGMNAHLAKPINRSLLRETIEAWASPAHVQPSPIHGATETKMHAFIASPRTSQIDIDELILLFEGKRGSIVSLLDAALLSIQADLRAILIGNDAHDTTIITSAAHHIKGTAGSLGAFRLIAIASNIYQTVSPPLAPDLLTEIDRSIKGITREILAYKSTTAYLVN